MTQSNLRTFAPQPTGGEAYALPSIEKTSSITVVGAGAFGGWTAWHLLQRGYKVTLIDAWGPGNARASSGDETRVIRSTYGDNALYFDLNVRARELWKAHEKILNIPLFIPSGVLWMCYDEHAPVVDQSMAFAEKHGMPYRRLTQAELKKEFPHIETRDIHHGFFDPYGGYLKARESCLALVKAFVSAGGIYIQGLVGTPAFTSGKLESIRLSDGSTVTSDLFIFACGAWMESLIEKNTARIHCTKQEVYYFGVPAANAAQYDALPVWIDVDGEDFYYGIPGNANRGFKVGVDIRGGAFDPTDGERVITSETLTRARKFIAHRFPGLAHAPLVENRVCPYENSPDGNFIIDVHPEAENLLLMAGGSGHGFKHGPALGEWVADALEQTRNMPALFSLRRF